MRVKNYLTLHYTTLRDYPLKVREQLLEATDIDLEGRSSCAGASHSSASRRARMLHDGTEF